MRVIGLTGGIACGKSTVSSQLHKEFGAVILDADLIAYNLSEPGNKMWKLYISRYGKERVLNADGTLNRAAIAEIVFQDNAEKQWMDDTMHPLIQNELLTVLSECKKKGQEIVVLDVPLLFEAGWETLPDEVWVVYVAPDIQIKRLMDRNAVTKDVAQYRIAAQMSLDEKKRRADVVIDNSGTYEETMLQVRKAFLSGGRKSSPE